MGVGTDLAPRAGMRCTLLLTMAALSTGAGCFQFPGEPALGAVEPDTLALDLPEADAPTLDAPDEIGTDAELLPDPGTEPEASPEAIDDSAGPALCTVTRRQVGCEEFEERLTFGEDGALLVRESSTCGSISVSSWIVERDVKGRLVGLDQEKPADGEGGTETVFERRFEWDGQGRLTRFFRDNVFYNHPQDADATLVWAADGALAKIEVTRFVGGVAEATVGSPVYAGKRLDEVRWDLDGDGTNDATMTYGYDVNAFHRCEKADVVDWPGLPCETWSSPTSSAWDADADGEPEWQQAQVLDEAGRIVERTESEAGTTSRYLYDEAGRMTESSHDTDGDGEPETVSTYTWDAEGYLIEIQQGTQLGAKKTFEVQREGPCSGGEPFDPFSVFLANPWHPLWYPQGGNWLAH